MRNLFRLSILTLGMASEAFSGTISWVGGGTPALTDGAAIPKATVAGVKTRSTDNVIRFKLKERSNIVFVCDGSTTAGKNLFSNLLAAKAMNSEVVFQANCSPSQWGTECGVDEFILGNAIF